MPRPPPLRPRRAFVVPGALVLAGAAAAAAWRLLRPPPAGPFGRPVRAGRPEAYAVGDVRAWPTGRFYMVRAPHGFLALSQQCPHLGCTVSPPAAGAFECRCHLSRFSLTGGLLRGPAQRPMDRYPIQLQDGELVVATGAQALIRRDRDARADAFDPRPVA